MPRPKKNRNAGEAVEAAEVAQENILEDAQTDGETNAPATFTQEQVQEMISKAVAQALANAQQQPQKLVAQEEMVTVLYLDEVSQNSTLELPGFGSMRPQSYIEIPKKDFGNKFMGIPLARKLIERRHLIVTSGLTQDERERWGCDYKDGELLDERTFDKMLDYPTPQLAAIFERLCPEHQRFVARRMITAKERNDSRISIEKTKKINELSKKNDPNGMLKPVLQAFGVEIAE